jgi:DNA-binding transcriptional LysR family regulator
MTVTLRQLEYFVAIVDEGSFTRAAESLQVSQPGLSRQFQALERDVGGPLVERLSRRVLLTPAGRAMLPYARAALTDTMRAADAARRVATLDAGELYVATFYSHSLGILPEALSIWRRQHPNVAIRLFEHRLVEELAAGMLAGQADVAIGPPPADWDGPIRSLGAEELVIVIASDDPAAAGRPHSIRLADLADRDWVHYTPESALCAVLDNACASAGFTPRVAVRTEQGGSAARLAAAGLGPTLVPGNIIPARFPAHLARPDPPVRRELCAYTRVHPDEVTSAFVTTIADSALLTPAHVRRRIGM